MSEEYLLQQDRQLESREQTVPFEAYIKLEEKCEELKEKYSRLETELECLKNGGTNGK